MKLCLALATVGFLLAAAIPQPVEACSWSYARGHSPKEIKRRNDVMVIRANFRFEEMRGEPGLNDEGEEALFNAEVMGHIERGTTRLKTIHYPERKWGTCVFPATGPTADARGTFWISERREGGRHRILYWEGEYLRPEQNQADQAD